MNAEHGFGKTVEMAFADAVALVTKALRSADFGVLTEGRRHRSNMGIAS